MTTKTFYPTQVSQTSGGNYRKFKDLNVIKNTNNGYAESNGDIQGKKGTLNRPSMIDATKFNCKIPQGAIINKITIELKHSKTGTSNKESCNIPAPTLSLLYNGHIAYTTESSDSLIGDINSPAGGGYYTGTFYYSKKNQAPKMEADYKPVTFTGKNSVTLNVANNKGKYTSKKVNTKYKLLTRNVVNDNSFGVRINYPTNTNDYKGKIRIWWVRVTIDYTLSAYSLKMSQITSDDTGYNNEDYKVKLQINRTSKTDYIPSVTLTTPLGFTYKGDDIQFGTFEQISNHVFKWTPNLSKAIGVSNSSIEIVFGVSVTYSGGATSYEGVFEAVESLNNATATHTAHITDRPIPPKQTADTNSEPIIPDSEIQPENTNITFAEAGKNFNIFPEFTAEEIANSPTWSGGTHDGQHYFIWVSYSNPNFAGTLTRLGSWNIMEEDLDEAGNYTRRLMQSNPGQYTYKIFSGASSSVGTVIREINVEVYPNNLTPSMSIIPLSKEETARLGDGYSYTVQSYLKEGGSESYVRDWGKNFRIGVFNNRIGTPTTINIPTEDGGTEIIEYDSHDYNNLTTQEIYENAEYWSPCPTSVNTYTNLECRFMYDKDYPLYILIVGDYAEATNPKPISYTEPCIIETNNYTERQKNGIFPEPFNNLLDDDDSSLLQLEAYTQSNGLVFYDFPVDEDFGTTEEMAIRGIAISGNLEQASEQVIYAKLRSPTGEIGQRSIIVSDVNTNVDADNDFTIGGVGDLWGYSMLDLSNIDDWSIELIVSNILDGTVSNINWNDITVTFFVEYITKQSINIKINDEDLSFYNAYISNVVIPPGLETDVDFLTIDGTDTNDAYRQNIKEKIIELEFDVGETCDLADNTTTLRQVVKLLTNSKDKYNRPIPKRIEFSHYPDVYFEYIMKESPDVSVSVNSYTVKAKIVIPSGTAYAKESITTNTIGYVQGLTAVEPIITLTPTSDKIVITETISGQTFQINYNGDWNGKIVEIDCEDMIVWLKQNTEDVNPLNITAFCDYNVDWFRLYGEYVFNSTNCVIRTIDYITRE